jgi:hypothetical protein
MNLEIFHPISLPCSLFSHSVLRMIVIANIVPSSPIIVTVMMMAMCIPTKRLFLQESRGAISQKAAFSIITAMKTSNLLDFWLLKKHYRSCK